MRRNPRIRNKLSKDPTTLAVADLEVMIEKTVRKIVRQEIDRLKSENLKVEIVKTQNPPQAFLDTFGTWEDTRTAEEIIEDIYASRTLPKKDNL